METPILNVTTASDDQLAVRAAWLDVQFFAEGRGVVTHWEGGGLTTKEWEESVDISVEIRTRKMRKLLQLKG